MNPSSPPQVIVNYASGAARAEEVVAELKAAGGDAIAVGGNVGKVRLLGGRMFTVPSRVKHGGTGRD